MTELKPCPFCGGEAVLNVYGYGVSVSCSQCDVHLGRIYKTVEEAIEHWNKRVGSVTNEQPPTDGKESIAKSC